MLIQFKGIFYSHFCDNRDEAITFFLKIIPFVNLKKLLCHCPSPQHTPALVQFPEVGKMERKLTGCFYMAALTVLKHFGLF